MTTKDNGIHRGDVIHHHDQYWTGPISASLSVRKIRNRIVPIPNPLFDDLFSDITLII